MSKYGSYMVEGDILVDFNEYFKVEEKAGRSIKRNEREEVIAKALIY